MRVLHISCSPRGEQSVSLALGQTFLEALREKHADIDVDTLDVWNEEFPDFDRPAIGAKYKRVSKVPMTPDEQSAWTRIEDLIRRFQRADRIVLGVPTWNFSYPYKLKQLIDLVSQRRFLFDFDGTKYRPLLAIPRALVIHVRGQSHDPSQGPGSPGFEHQAAYLEFWLTFIGVAEVRTLFVEHTWDERAIEYIEQGKAHAVAMAANF